MYIFLQQKIRRKSEGQHSNRESKQELKILVDRDRRDHVRYHKEGIIGSWRISSWIWEEEGRKRTLMWTRAVMKVVYFKRMISLAYSLHLLAVPWTGVLLFSLWNCVRWLLMAHHFPITGAQNILACFNMTRHKPLSLYMSTSSLFLQGEVIQLYIIQVLPFSKDIIVFWGISF